MSENNSGFECQTVCWGVSAAVGIVSIVMLYMFGGYAGLQAIFVGAFVAVALGVVLGQFLCRGQTAAADLASEEKPAQRYAREAEEKRAGTAGQGTAAPSDTSAAPAPMPHAEPVAAPAATAAVPRPVIVPSKALAGQAELSGRKGSWKYEGAGDKPGEVDRSKAVPAGETEAPAVTPEEGAPVTKVDKQSAIPAGTTAAPAVSPESADAVAESAPKLYDVPPSEGADDLKLISGVGPKLEQTLNDLGIYRFDQIADWGDQEVAWVDSRVRFKGRITRDDWMGQARTLAAGGETEFSKRKKT